MKTLLLAFTFVSCAFVHAGEIGVSLFPERPLVITSDAVLQPNKELIRGPWFKGSYQIKNETPEAITIVSLQFSITSLEGVLYSYGFAMSVPVEVVPGATFTFDQVYVQEIPASASNTYQVELEVHGWSGPAAESSERTLSKLSFSTQ